MAYFISFLDEKTKKAKTDVVIELTRKNLDYIDAMLPHIYKLYAEAEKILSQGDISKRYRTTYIPKSSGGKRRIDEPIDAELKIYMKNVVNVFTNKLQLIFPPSAYAYIKGRNNKQMAEAHKGNRMILKVDIKNFFPNCTLKFILDSMLTVYPFCVMDIDVLETIVKACMIEYNGEYGLPQGAPTSPLLSNIAMIPVDYALMQYCNEKQVYTRFADDIYISYRSSKYYTSELNYKPAGIENILQRHNPKFRLNTDKTHLVSFSKEKGIWITGIMLNSNNDITIGYKTKKRMKAIIWSFLMDSKNKKYWSKEEVYKMLGVVGYWKYIEPEYVKLIIQRYEIKTGMNYQKEIDNICFK